MPWFNTKRDSWGNNIQNMVWTFSGYSYSSDPMYHYSSRLIPTDIETFATLLKKYFKRILFMKLEDRYKYFNFNKQFKDLIYGLDTYLFDIYEDKKITLEKLKTENAKHIMYPYYACIEPIFAPFWFDLKNLFPFLKEEKIITKIKKDNGYSYVFKIYNTWHQTTLLKNNFPDYSVNLNISIWLHNLLKENTFTKFYTYEKRTISTSLYSRPDKYIEHYLKLNNPFKNLIEVIYHNEKPNEYKVKKFNYYNWSKHTYSHTEYDTLADILNINQVSITTLLDIISVLNIPKKLETLYLNKAQNNLSNTSLNNKITSIGKLHIIKFLSNTKTLDSVLSKMIAQKIAAAIISLISNNLTTPLETLKTDYLKLFSYLLGEKTLDDDLLKETYNLLEFYRINESEYYKKVTANAV